MHPDLDARKRRIRFRAGHRGMKELDILFGRLARETLDDLDAAGVAAFERLLRAADADVLAWIAGTAAPPLECDGPLLERLRGYRFSAGDYDRST